MTFNYFEKSALLISGLTAIVIGGMITVMPHVFYAGYGITIGNDPNLLSELRAPGAGLVAFGSLILLGVWRSALAQLAMTATLVVFLAFPAGRVIGIALDGLPSTGIIWALILEIAIAVLCLFAFRRHLLGRWGTA